MNEEERIKRIKDKAKDSAKELFEDLPDDIKEELRKETTLGNPRNLVKPSAEEE